MTTEERLAALELRVKALERTANFHQLDPLDAVIETVEGDIHIMPDPQNSKNYILRSAVTLKILGAVGSLEFARAEAQRIHLTGRMHI